MADNIFVIDNDSRSHYLSDTIVTAAFALKGDIRWGKSLSALDEMIKRHGNPRFLVLDNDLDGELGIKWIRKALQEGKLPPETIIAAISSSNVELVFEEHQDLNTHGIGAFLKPHVAEMCLWMGLRDRDLNQGEPSAVSQYEVYDVNRVNQIMYTEFGKNIYKSIYPQGYLSELHHPRTWPYADGGLIVGETNTVGVFQHLLSSDLEPRELMGWESGRFIDAFARIRNEGNGKNPERDG